MYEDELNVAERTRGGGEGGGYEEAVSLSLREVPSRCRNVKNVHVLKPHGDTTPLVTALRVSPVQRAALLWLFSAEMSERAME